VATRSCARFATARSGTIKPTCPAILEKDVVKAEGRRRTKRRTDLDMIVSYEEDPWPAVLRPCGEALSARSVKEIPARDGCGCRDIERGDRPRDSRYDDSLVG